MHASLCKSGLLEVNLSHLKAVMGDAILHKKTKILKAIEKQIIGESGSMKKDLESVKQTLSQEETDEEEVV